MILFENLHVNIHMVYGNGFWPDSRSLTLPICGRLYDIESLEFSSQKNQGYWTSFKFIKRGIYDKLGSKNVWPEMNVVKAEVIPLVVLLVGSILFWTLSRTHVDSVFNRDQNIHSDKYTKYIQNPTVHRSKLHLLLTF